MLYLDANVFIYAAINQDAIGDQARSLLRRVQQGKTHAVSSLLTFDELVWAIKRYRSFEDAINAGKAFLLMPGLRLIDVNEDIIALALELMEKHRLDPRDAIHASSAILEDAEAIVSSDEHFDKLKEIPRRDIVETS
ncbi:MAG: type II toxin-antitoxin system VapC family toxin [Thaumarchaeota archaeon]|nr:type II toxin-antitoxin system VapC family toxin [Nitrososphaerota archaeon]